MDYQINFLNFIDCNAILLSRDESDSVLVDSVMQVGTPIELVAIRKATEQIVDASSSLDFCMSRGMPSVVC